MQGCDDLYVGAFCESPAALCTCRECGNLRLIFSDFAAGVCAGCCRASVRQSAYTISIAHAATRDAEGISVDEAPAQHVVAKGQGCSLMSLILGEFARPSDTRIHSAATLFRN